MLTLNEIFHFSGNQFIFSKRNILCEPNSGMQYLTLHTACTARFTGIIELLLYGAQDIADFEHAC